MRFYCENCIPNNRHVLWFLRKGNDHSEDSVKEAGAGAERTGQVVENDSSSETDITWMHTLRQLVNASEGS
jgi:hypothetical protein